MRKLNIVDVDLGNHLKKGDWRENSSVVQRGFEPRNSQMVTHMLTT